jgi:hypothetical protein
MVFFFLVIVKYKAKKDLNAKQNKRQPESGENFTAVPIGNSVYVPVSRHLIRKFIVEQSRQYKRKKASQA